MFKKILALCEQVSLLVVPGGGGNGGSGIVIISAPLGVITATGGTHTTTSTGACGQTSCDIWTFTTSGTWTPTAITN